MLNAKKIGAAFTAILILTLSGARAYSHGEDKPGPHGGMIRMPGIFHVEVVPRGPGRIDVFLLDVDFKNPTVLRSRVTGRILKPIPQSAAPEASIFTCAIHIDFFRCVFPADSVASADRTLELTPVREGQRGKPVTYDLPVE